MTHAIDHVDVVHRIWTHLEHTHDLSVLDRYFHPDYVRHAGEGRHQDLDGWKQTLNSLYTAFPDLTTTIELTVADENWVTYKWSSEGHHQGTYFGAPPTGKRVRATGITMKRFVDGRIIEEHSSWNKVDVLHALGILPITAV